MSVYFQAQIKKNLTKKGAKKSHKCVVDDLKKADCDLPKLKDRKKRFSLKALFPLCDLTQRKEEMKPRPEFFMVSVPVYQDRFWEAVIPIHRRRQLSFREPVAPIASVSSAFDSGNRWF